MPSSQTPNYNLNQWSKDDRVLMEDFNADNAKIDAAIGAVAAKAASLAAEKADKAALDAVAAACPYVKLLDYTSTAAVTRLDVDVYGIDFTPYHKIELFYETPNASAETTMHVNGAGCEGGNSYTYRLLGSAGGGGQNYLSYLAKFGKSSTGIILFFKPIANSSVGCVTMQHDGTHYHAYQIRGGATWDKLETFNFVGRATLPAGTKVTIFGLKK